MKEHNIYFSFNTNTEYNDIIDLITSYTLNFSIIDVLGYYKGKSENSKCLRIIDLDDSLWLKPMIESMKILGNQECILLTTTEIKGMLI